MDCRQRIPVSVFKCAQTGAFKSTFNGHFLYGNNISVLPFFTSFTVNIGKKYIWKPCLQPCTALHSCSSCPLHNLAQGTDTITRWVYKVHIHPGGYIAYNHPERAGWIWICTFPGVFKVHIHPKCEGSDSERLKCFWIHKQIHAMVYIWIYSILRYLLIKIDIWILI